WAAREGDEAGAVTRRRAPRLDDAAGARAEAERGRAGHGGKSRDERGEARTIPPDRDVHVVPEGGAFARGVSAAARGVEIPDVGELDPAVAERRGEEHTAKAIGPGELGTGRVVRRAQPVVVRRWIARLEEPGRDRLEARRVAAKEDA